MSKLQVETISHTNNTTAQTIDSTGRILTPARPSFYVRGNDGWKDHGTSVVVYFKTSNQAVEVISNVGNHYDASTGKFTVPVTGLYQFNCHLYMNDNGDNSNFAVMYKNGSHLLNGFFITMDTGGNYPDSSLSFATSVELSASDEITVRVAEDVYGHHSFWNGHLVG